MQSNSKKIFITGFSGAGKSTMLKDLSQVPFFKNWELIDLDLYIERKFCESGESLGEFIERVGWEDFRSKEKSCLIEFSENSKPLVLALGAGALEGGNDKILHGFEGFFLDTDFEICWKRIENDSNRPLTRLGKEAVFEIYKKRLPTYHQYKKLDRTSELIEFIKK